MLVVTKVVAMAQAFQIVSVSRSLTNWGHPHVTAIDTAPRPGFPASWPIASILSALAAGDLFYTIIGRGDPAFARRYRCMCGFETIRTTPADDTKDGLESISIDECQEQEFTPALF